MARATVRMQPVGKHPERSRDADGGWLAAAPRARPRPCCGSGAYFYMVESDGLIDGRAGGWFVECNNSECRLTTQLMFATGEDPRPHLREIWNKRHNAELTGHCPQGVESDH